MGNVERLGAISPLKEGEPIHLFPREQKVLNLAALGLYIKEIGDKMVIELDTVRKYRTFILNAFGVDNMLEAVIKGAEAGNIDL